MQEDHIPPHNHEKLVRQMKAHYQKFLAACNTLTKESALAPGICGEWSAKAVVDHLTGWQVQSLLMIKQLLSSEKEIFDIDIDAFNHISVETREDLSWDKSLEAFKLSYEAFDEALHDLPGLQYRTNEGLKSWLRAMIHEYRFHLKHIEKAGRS